MAKYTTLVRSICEVNSGLDESVGARQVDDVISKSWNKIFTSNVSFFDENYRAVICSKILKHYYMYEIGAETAGLWIFWMNRRLEEIMPYYNQLYESEKLKFEPLTDVKFTREFDRTSDTKKESASNGSGNSSQNSSSREKFADTPQGSLTDVLNGNYLSSATVSDGDISANYEDNSNTNGSENLVDHYIESVMGKQGGKGYAEMLQEFRGTFLNIDMMVIEEFEDLFMGLW